MEHTAMRQKKALGPILLQRARAAESGQTMIEFALMLPFMMLLLLGVTEIGRAAFISIKIGNAATAGAEYGSTNSTDAQDSTGIQNAALCDANGTMSSGSPPVYGCNSSGILTSGNITNIYGCACDTGSGTSCSPMPASGSCATLTCSGQTVQCVQVTTHASFNALFHFPGLPATYQANGKAIQRVRQQ